MNISSLIAATPTTKPTSMETEEEGRYGEGMDFVKVGEVFRFDDGIGLNG